MVRREQTEDDNMATWELACLSRSVHDAIATLDAWNANDGGCECDICKHLRRARQAAAIAAREVDSALAMHRECDDELTD